MTGSFGSPPTGGAVVQGNRSKVQLEAGRLTRASEISAPDIVSTEGPARARCMLIHILWLQGSITCTRKYSVSHNVNTLIKQQLIIKSFKNVVKVKN